MSLHEPQYDRWSSRMPTIVSSYSNHIVCVLRLVNRADQGLQTTACGPYPAREDISSILEE